MRISDFRGIFLDNLTLKAISLVLAFLLWVQIAGQQRVQRPIAVPLEFINMPEGIEITNEYPKEINIVISKPSSVRMDESQLTAVIDMSGSEPGNSLVTLTERSIRNIPPGVAIEGIERRRIRLDLEQVRSKVVEVVPEIQGQPAEGYQLVEARANPVEIQITGPVSRLEKVATAQTEPIDITGRSAPFSRNVYVDLEDPRLRIEQVSSVDVLVDIQEQRRDIKMRLRPRAVAPGRSVILSHRTIEVVFSVPVSYTESLDSSRFTVQVLIPESARAGQALEIAPTVVIPEDLSSIVRFESTNPTHVRATISR